ncbi:hypothetical protein [Nodularia spumigena]|uniref:hypothetical protein n=1 Tax=Nodularia spumigena TaxID=70799 RepID=UPI0030DA8917
MSQRGLLPQGEANAKGVSLMSDWRTPKGSKVKKLILFIKTPYLIFTRGGKFLLYISDMYATVAKAVTKNCLSKAKLKIRKPDKLRRNSKNFQIWKKFFNLVVQKTQLMLN